MSPALSMTVIQTKIHLDKKNGQKDDSATNFIGTKHL